MCDSYDALNNLITSLVKLCGNGQRLSRQVRDSCVALEALWWMAEELAGSSCHRHMKTVFLSLLVVL